MCTHQFKNMHMNQHHKGQRLEKSLFMDGCCTVNIGAASVNLSKMSQDPTQHHMAHTSTHSKPLWHRQRLDSPARS
jgi:hypothetical protein